MFLICSFRTSVTCNMQMKKKIQLQNFVKAWIPTVLWTSSTSSVTLWDPFPDLLFRFTQTKEWKCLLLVRYSDNKMIENKATLQQQPMHPHGPSKYHIWTQELASESAVHLPWCISATGCASLTVPGWCNSHWHWLLVGSAPQNDSVLYAPFGYNHNSSAFSPKTAEQRGCCHFGWHKWSSYRAQMSQCSQLNSHCII